MTKNDDSWSLSMVTPSKNSTQRLSSSLLFLLFEDLVLYPILKNKTKTLKSVCFGCKSQFEVHAWDTRESMHNCLHQLISNHFEHIHWMFLQLFHLHEIGCSSLRIWKFLFPYNRQICIITKAIGHCFENCSTINDLLLLTKQSYLESQPGTTNSFIASFNAIPTFDSIPHDHHHQLPFGQIDRQIVSHSLTHLSCHLCSST